MRIWVHVSSSKICITEAHSACISASICHPELMMVYEACWTHCALVPATWPWQLQLSWQQSGRVAVSWEIAAELTFDCWVSIPQPSWQKIVELTDCNLWDRVKKRRQSVAQPTCCSWDDKLHLTNRVQLSWHVAADLTAELTNCNWDFRLQLSWQTELTDCCQAETSWLSRQIAAEMTDCKGPCTLQLSWCFCSWSVTADELHDRIH